MQLVNGFASTEEASSQLEAYLALVRGKEYAGQERAGRLDRFWCGR